MEKILEVNNLEFSFNTYGGQVKAVRGISFDVNQGEIVGIVGESGCGKSVTAQCILKLNPEPPGFFGNGSIKYKGEDIVPMSERKMKKIRGLEIGFVFQDPMTSLNPTMKIGKQIEEVFIERRKYSKKEIKEKVLDILSLVGISDGEIRYNQYPHELSGGMKQRVMIAIALVGRPSLIIADEPTTSLDVTIEAQILDLLMDLKQKLGAAIIIITHDLGVIAKLCDRVLVMYGGKIVEKGLVNDIFYNTRHPYTSGLLNSIAGLETKKTDELSPIEGTPPDLFSPPQGCPFASRCEYAMEICYEELPDEYSISDEHETMCWLEHENAPNVVLKREASQESGII